MRMTNDGGSGPPTSRSAMTQEEIKFWAMRIQGVLATLVRQRRKKRKS
jgi:hypothetical protein